MNRRSAIISDPEAGQRLQGFLDLALRRSNGGLSDLLSHATADLGLRSALWLWTDGAVELIAAAPSEGLDSAGVGARIPEWAAALDGPVFHPGEPEGPALAKSSRSQLIWPFRLEGSERALWVVESDEESLPDLSITARLLHVAVMLLRGSQRQGEHESLLQDLRSAQELMGHVVDALPVGLYVVDEGFRIVAWNRKRETGTQGVAREDAIGKSVFEVLYRQPKERISSEL